MKTLLFNAHIYAHPDDTALLINDARIEKTGTLETLQNESDECVDAKGAWIYPGFHDSHLHLIMTGQALSCAPLQNARSMKDIQTLVQEQIDKSERVVHGMGWNQEDLNEKRMPTRTDLDAVSADIPIVIERSCTHILTANSAAMQKAGCWKEDGIFSEDDCLPFMKLLEENEEEQLNAAVDHCLEKGLTAVQPADLKSGNWRRRLPLYKKASEKIRIHHQVNITDPKEMREFMGAFEAYRTPTHTYGPFKGFADGALGGRTAWMQEDYADDPGNRGIRTMDEAAMDAFVRSCKELDRPVVFHAIGDQAIRQILDVFARYQDAENTLRWGILHVQITDADLVQRLIDQHICVYAQPVFWKADQAVVESRVGKEKAATSYAFGTLKRGTHLSMGTDCPIEDCDVFENAYWALHMPHALTMDEIRSAVTEESAYMSHQENELGKIEPGFLADLTFLDQEWTETSRPEVLGTMVNGKLNTKF